MVDQAFVLHRYAYQEHGLLLKVFTRLQGLSSIIVKGAKKRKSDHYSVLQCFQPLKLDYVQTREVGSLKFVERHGTAPVLAGSALYSAFYLNELLLHLLMLHDPMPNIFDLYAHTLAHLDLDIEVNLRFFELNLLKHLGYLPDFNEDKEGAPITNAQNYVLMPGQALSVLGQNQKTASVYVFQGLDLNSINKGEWTNTSLKAAKRLCRILIEAHTRGKTFKSREIFAAALDLG